METTTAIPTKTFKEVHAELESEHLFLQKEHDIQNFKTKAEFLNTIGFNNSIATKLYSAVANNANVVHDYNQRYLGRYKFILEPQLERGCEKYNLYVREPEFFLGDIPENNIKDIMDFKVFLKDIITQEIFAKYHNQFMQMAQVETRSFIQPEYETIKISLLNLPDYLLKGRLEIAAIKPLFAEQAFANSQARIIKAAELGAKNQVELDPIVLFNTRHGRIIITAWGDEANDELVVNQNKN